MSIAVRKWNIMADPIATSPDFFTYIFKTKSAMTNPKPALERALNSLINRPYAKLETP